MECKNIIQAVKDLKALGWSKMIKQELNCIKFEVRWGRVSYALTNTRILVYGTKPLEIEKEFDLLIDRDMLLKAQKPIKFGFFEGGIRVDTTEGTKTLKNKAGRFADYERIIPQKFDYSFECDFSQLGGLLKALGNNHCCCDVRIQVKDGELEFYQCSSSTQYYDNDPDFWGDEFSMSLPFDGELKETLLVNWRVIDFLSKNKIKKVSIARLYDTPILCFEKNGNNFIVMTIKFRED